MALSKLTWLHLTLALLPILTLSNCADSRKSKQWDSIDYSKVRNRDTYESDSSYKLPSVYSCTNDDLYNCN